MQANGKLAPDTATQSSDQVHQTFARKRDDARARNYKPRPKALLRVIELKKVKRALFYSSKGGIEATVN